MRGADLKYPAIIVSCALLLFYLRPQPVDGAPPKSPPAAALRASLSAAQTQKSENPRVDSAGEHSVPDTKPAEADTNELRERWGIEPLGVRLSAGGYMLDFRFRVLDPGRAAILFDHKNKPCLIDQKTGAKFAVPTPPKVGALRTSRTPKAGTISFMLFANPGEYVKAGNKVTIEVGEFSATDLTVQ